MNVRADDNSIEPKEVVIKWDTPPHANVYELSSYTVEKKPLLDNNAAFLIVKTVDAEVTELKLTGLEPDTAYLVKVVSHRKNSQKTGEKEMDITTAKGKLMPPWDKKSLVLFLQKKKSEMNFTVRNLKEAKTAVKQSGVKSFHMAQLSKLFILGIVMHFILMSNGAHQYELKLPVF